MIDQHVIEARATHKNQHGQVSLLFALTATALLGAAGVAIDMFRMVTAREQLQEIADTLAIRGAREFLLANASEAQVEALLTSLAPSFHNQVDGAFDITVDTDRSDRSVSVDIAKAAPSTLFLKRSSDKEPLMRVSATAAAAGGGNVCVVALDAVSSGAIAVDGSAELAAADCTLYSNSNSGSGVRAVGMSMVTSQLTCSGGGYEGPDGNFAPPPTTDCPAYPDPLESRVAPSVGPCDYVNYEISINHVSDGRGGTIKTQKGVPIPVHPGVYCGGIKVKNNVHLKFEPGTFIIKDGPLVFGKKAYLQGENVSFYLMGDGATFTFEKDSKIELTAEKEGPLAGLLFFEDRNARIGQVHEILSDDAHEFLGTIYLPNGTLRVDAKNPIADASAYTAIVTRKLEVDGGVRLVLNADYNATDIPVPDGVGPVGHQIRLRQ